jgi:mannobiose 2-epimerase
MPFNQWAARQELERLAAWWLARAPDTGNGGFIGEIASNGVGRAGADKGAVYHSRLLWFFSEMARVNGGDRFGGPAHDAFEYLCTNFHDERFGGPFWSLSAKGEVVDDTKKLYAVCFCIYGLCAYYRLVGSDKALGLALQYFDLLQSVAADNHNGGYFEAFSRDWQRIDDARLDPGDRNAPKGMNTHLHIIEAMTALYRVTGSLDVARPLHNAVQLYCEHIVDAPSGHLFRYFDTDWQRLDHVISFGHAIESSWLLWESAMALHDDALASHVRPIVVQLARSCLDEGLGDRGQLCDEFDLQSGRLNTHSIWWVQAEALVGFLNAWQLSGEQPFRDACDAVWQNIVDNHIDHVAGEWDWTSRLDKSGDDPDYKGGFWKGPYHNGRAMLECISRLQP